MKRKAKGFTLVELMIVVVILGILAAIAIPAFIKYIRQSKTSEAKENLGYIYKGFVTYYQEEHTDGSGNVTTLFFPTAAGGPLPVVLPQGTRTPVPAALWEADKTFDAIRFSVTEPLYYQYTTASAGGPGNGANFTATANGDLDGDGKQSTFKRAANVVGGEPVGAPLTETDPTE